MKYLQNNLDIDLYKAIAIAIQRIIMTLKVKLFETALANNQLEDS